MFKVGDRVRRVSGTNTSTPLGFEGVITALEGAHVHGGRDAEYVFDSRWGYAYNEGGSSNWELVQTGPVVTETVTKTRIVSGRYGRIEVRAIYSTQHETNGVGVAFLARDGGGVAVAALNADELDAAAAVLTALAKGLRDV